MTTLSSLNTLRANGLSLVESVAGLSHEASNGDALCNVKGDAITNIATALESAENASVPNVLAYGAARAILQFAIGGEKYCAAALDKADKKAIGWTDLASNSPAKRRLSQYHSRFRKIAEDWATVPESERNELFAGKRSFLTIYDGIVKRERDAKKAEAEAEAKAEAEAAIAEAKAEGVAESVAEATLTDLIAMVAARFAVASAEERDAAETPLIALVELFNAEAESDAATIAEAA